LNFLFNVSRYFLLPLTQPSYKTCMSNSHSLDWQSDFSGNSIRLMNTRR
jgi:hypothetical protein